MPVMATESAEFHRRMSGLPRCFVDDEQHCLLLMNAHAHLLFIATIDGLSELLFSSFRILTKISNRDSLPCDSADADE
jgi:hypothetical protein